MACENDNFGKNNGGAQRGGGMDGPSLDALFRGIRLEEWKRMLMSPEERLLDSINEQEELNKIGKVTDEQLGEVRKWVHDVMDRAQTDKTEQ